MGGLGPRPLRSSDPARAAGFDLLGRLGSGGFGTVYLGRRPTTAGTARADLLAAVKCLKAELAEDEQQKKRFRAEGEALRRCGGARIPAVLAMDLADAARPAIASRFIPGPALDTVVRSVGPLSGDVARCVAVDLAEAVHASHAAGVWHRDLKPSNVLLTEEGAWVIDFGLARIRGQRMSQSMHFAAGTVAYAAPEQLRGFTETNDRTDVFGLGAVVLFALTGHPPYALDGMDRPEAARMLGTAPLAFDGLPTDGLGMLVRACLAERPGDRPTITEVLRSLPSPGRLRLPERAAFVVRSFRENVRAHLNQSGEAIALTVPFRPSRESWSTDLGDWVDDMVVDRGGRVVAASGSGLVYTLSPGSGQVVEREAGFTAPVRLLRHEQVFVACDAVGRIRAGLIGRSGPQWSALPENTPPVSMAALGPMLFVADGGGVLRALDMWTGKEWWSAPPGTPGPRTVVGAAGSTIYTLERGGSVLAALRDEDGAPHWRHALRAAVLCPPVCTSRLVLLADTTGRLRCLGTTDGQQVWTRQLPRSVLCGLLAQDDSAVLGDVAGGMHRVDLGTGRPLWSTSVGSEEEIFCMAVTDGVVYAGGWSGHLHLVDLHSGLLLQSFTFGGQIVGIAALEGGGGLVYVATTQGVVHAMPISTRQGVG